MKKLFLILLACFFLIGVAVLPGISGQPAAYKINAGDARWHTKLNAGLDALWNNIIAFSTLITGWAIEDNIVTMVTAIPTYSNGTTFTVPGDYTSRFTAGKVVQARLAATTVETTVISSTYASPNTTVVLTDSVLTNPITRVYVIATRDGLWPNGPGYIVAADYGTDQAALATADGLAVAAGKQLLIGRTYSITSDLTLASSVKIMPGAILSIATTKTLTINGSLDAGLYQIFSCTGTGKVVFGNASVREIRATWFGEVADNSTDETKSIQDAIDSGTTNLIPVVLMAGTHQITNAITVTTSLQGVPVGQNYFENNGTTIRKINGNTTSTKALIVSGSAITVSDINLKGSETASSVLYALAAFPTGAPYDTENPDYGMEVSGHGNHIRNCRAYAFRLGGFYLSTLSGNNLIDCIAECNGSGVKVAATDSKIFYGYYNHNMGNGISNTTVYLTVVGARIEWNAQYGIYSVEGGEGIFVGNTFDRNGWSGICLGTGAGNVITGNYFSRNGCGGDGTVGRWGASTLGSSSYIATTLDQSSHIQLIGQKDCTITGNRFRAGQDDSGEGASAPAYIYTFSGTPGGNNMPIMAGNAGEQAAAAGIGGYNAAYPSATGYYCGGADTTLVGVQKFGYQYHQKGVSSSLFVGGPGTNVAGNVSSFTITLPVKTGGTISIWPCVFNEANYSLVHFTTDSTNGNLTTLVENKIGTRVSAAVLTNVDASTNLLTITLTGQSYCNWSGIITPVNP